ncbi:acyl-CoA dehydrogenase (plasmid) [Sphingomonas paeninsulae]|uniref:Acyl-CoA dehydrogenase n=1 Tax=Sphingomonas paeninsulae TaxID=2319844 RepID=A0A494TCP6_SPHPE|nr:acyl-CoA dehydrogenase family protein [Sphingomonas paeninsulae]AYJ84863.1 acyl-CoA dehydrogenase [Sphingomonas paeninsulae]
MNLNFSPEDRNFRAEARAWLADNVPQERPPSHSAELRAFELAWQKRQYDGGWAGIPWAKQYGGRGATPIQQLIWFEEYAAAGAPPVACLVVALNHGGPTLIVRGSEEQKSFHLPRILSGQSVWCQGFSEPGAGSDLAGLRTRAVIEGDHLVVTGQKIWTSYADVADFQELLVRTDPGAPKHNGLTWVICDMRAPGIEVRPIRTMAGHEHFCEVFYENVRIPLSNVVGAVNDGWNVAMATLGFERGTGYVGHLSRLAYAIEELISIANSPRGATDTIHAQLANCRAEIAALRAMTYMGISRPGDTPGPEGSMIALGYGELNQRVHRVAMEIIGSSSLDLDSWSSKWGVAYLDSFRQTIAGGTSEIRRNIIGERVLGLPRG